jgi:hypothetical protein
MTGSNYGLDSSGFRIGRPKPTIHSTPLTDVQARPAPANGDRMELRLIALKPLLYPCLTRDFHHWGLWLLPIGMPEGDLYHSRKVAFVDPANPNQNQHHCEGCSPPLSVPGHGFAITPNYDPRQSVRQSLHMSLTVSERVTATDLNRVCSMVNQRFPYSVAQNNCQNFAIRVLRQFVFEEVISMQQFDYIKDSAYPCALAYWNYIRNNSFDLRAAQPSATQQ